MNLKNTLLILSIFLTSHIYGQAQQSDSLQTEKKQPSLLKKSIVPISLISLGVLLNKSQFEQDLQGRVQDAMGEGYHNRIDDILPFVPIVEMYTADLLGVPAQNHWFDQSKNMFFSHALNSIITIGIKRALNKRRPDGGNHSFPSGHTSLAFTSAAVLQEEFKDTSPLLAYSGYAFATTTGTFRVLNNRHWLSDVLAGAGIGILSAKIIYHIKPLKNFNPFKKAKNMALLPQVGQGGSYGVYWALRF